MENKKLINKKISSEVGIGIVLLIAVAIGGTFYFQSKKENTTNTIEIKQPQKSITQTTPNTNNNQQNQADKKDPFENFSISSFDKWKFYSNKTVGIEINYPPELYLSSSDSEIVFNYLSPNSPAQKDEGSVLTRFNISLGQKTVKQYINENNLSTLQNFKDDKIQLSNTTADKITYTDAFAGGIMYVVLIQNNSNLIIIDYAGGNKLEDTFSRMLSTVKKI